MLGFDILVNNILENLYYVVQVMMNAFDFFRILIICFTIRAKHQ